MMNRKISIILVNYKSETVLERCLLSLKDFVKNVAYEIIVVNNDKEASLVKIQEIFPEIKILEQEKNLGFGLACNLGAKEATGEVFLFLNPDTEIVAGDFQEIFTELLDENKGILGSKIMKNGQIQPWIAGVEKSFWDLFKNNLGIKKSQKIWEAQQKTKAAWVAATAMFIRRDLFLALDGFDENIFMYFEDVDLCKRARILGKKIVYFPKFIVNHLGGQSFTNRKEQKKYYYSSQEYYFEKHCKKWEIFLIKMLDKILKILNRI